MTGLCISKIMAMIGNLLISSSRPVACEWPRQKSCGIASCVIGAHSNRNPGCSNSMALFLLCCVVHCFSSRASHAGLLIVKHTGTVPKQGIS